MYRSFGLEPPAHAGPYRQPLIWITALVFVVISATILVVLNFFTLFLGVTVNFLGRDGTKFRFLHLFRRIPLIGVTIPILFAYMAWYNARLSGALTVSLPPLLTIGLAVVLLGVIVLVNMRFGGRAGRR